MDEPATTKQVSTPTQKKVSSDLMTAEEKEKEIEFEDRLVNARKKGNVLVLKIVKLINRDIPPLFILELVFN